MFREHEGFVIVRDPGIRRPKGVPKSKKPKASRQPIRGDLSTTPKIEAAIWLSPRFKGGV